MSVKILLISQPIIFALLLVAAVDQNDFMQTIALCSFGSLCGALASLSIFPSDDVPESKLVLRLSMKFGTAMVIGAIPSPLLGHLLAQKYLTSIPREYVFLCVGGTCSLFGVTIIHRWIAPVLMQSTPASLAAVFVRTLAQFALKSIGVKGEPAEKDK